VVEQEDRLIVSAWQEVVEVVISQSPQLLVMTEPSDCVAVAHHGTGESA